MRGAARRILLNFHRAFCSMWQAILCFAKRAFLEIFCNSLVATLRWGYGGRLTTYQTQLVSVEHKRMQRLVMLLS
jgi:hypothetical protein